MLKLKLSSAKSCCGTLILVNQQHPLPDNAGQLHLDKCAEKLVQVMPKLPQVQMQRIAACELMRLLNHLHAEQQIQPLSGFRSHQGQQELYASALAEHGEDFTKKYVALPGCSEHETGLAIDMALILPQIDPLTPAFPYEGICQQFREAAANYGFIERYPEGKENTTGIGHEPWHFRYVGSPHAALINEQGLVLEEYMELIHLATAGGKFFFPPLPGKKVQISYIPATDNETIIQLRGNTPYSISGDNMGGFIITEWEG